MLVRGIGPKNPLLALVGEAPGAEEDRCGKPFVGNSGFLLDQMLAVAGISRHECYITNVVDKRPANNRLATLYTDQKKNLPKLELIEHRKRVLQELKEVNPKVIVAFGEEALRTLTLQEKIGNHRGMMIDVDYGLHHETRRRVLPTWHPAFVLRAYKERPVTELDLQKALRQARSPHTPETDFNVDPTFDEVMEFLAERRSPVAGDIETLGPCTRCFGFAWSGTEAISIPFITSSSHHWPEYQERMILQALNTYLLDPQVEFYFQNFPFDTTMIAREFGFHVDNIALDTMYAQHILYPELPKKLDFLCSIYTDFPRYWGEKNTSDRHNRIYNCFDCCTCWISAQAQIDELRERGLYDFYRDRVQPTAAALTRMQNRGILVDEKARAVVRVETLAKMEKAQETLKTLVGFDLNPDSPKQVAELVYDKWKLPKQTKPGTKQVTADETALRALGRKYPERAPVIHTILDCRKTRKLISTYIDTELIGGRATTSYGLTVSGRITSKAGIDGGGNLQNIPRGSFRKLYIPDEGKTLIKADLKQAEYMVFCWAARVHEYIERYTNDPTFDVHTLNASLFFGIPITDVPKAKRYMAKQGVYAGNYKIGPLKMSRMYEITFTEAKHVLERYKAVRPELAQWWNEIETQIRSNRTIVNPFGRERIFFGRIDDELMRKAYNHYCQSTVADLINEAVVTLDAYEDGLVDMMLQVHDELVCQVDSAHVTEGVARVRAAMEIPITFPYVDTPLIIPAEIAVGPNWHDVIEVA